MNPPNISGFVNSAKLSRLLLNPLQSSFRTDSRQASSYSVIGSISFKLRPLEARDFCYKTFGKGEGGRGARERETDSEKLMKSSDIRLTKLLVPIQGEMGEMIYRGDVGIDTHMN